MKRTPEQIREAYKKLPPTLKEVFDAEETDEIIIAIQKQFGITIDQMGDLSEEVGAVFLGLTRASDFPREIKGRLGLDETKTNEIVKTVNEQIFAKIREHLQNAEPVAVTGKESVRPEVNLQTTSESLTSVVSMPLSAPSYPRVPATIPLSAPSASTLVEQKLAAPFAARAVEIKNGGNGAVAQSAATSKMIRI